jgi:hypothetical protein
LEISFQLVSLSSSLMTNFLHFNTLSARRMTEALDNQNLKLSIKKFDGKDLIFRKDKIINALKASEKSNTIQEDFQLNDQNEEKDEKACNYLGHVISTDGIQTKSKPFLTKGHQRVSLN